MPNLNLDSIDSNYLFEVLKPLQVKICPLAVLEHATTSYQRNIEEENGNTIGTASSEAVANIRPNRSMLARIRGSAKTVENLDRVVEVTIDRPIASLAISRSKATAEVLFDHLMINCPPCPRADYCGQRILIANLAHELNTPLLDIRAETE